MSKFVAAIFSSGAMDEAVMTSLRLQRYAHRRLGVSSLLAVAIGGVWLMSSI